MEDNKIAIAQRCYAALGNVSKAQYLRNVIVMAEKSVDGFEDPSVQAKLLVLKGRTREAESILLRYGMHCLLLCAPVIKCRENSRR